FIDANPRALASLGYDKEEIRNLGFADLLEMDDLPRALDAALEVLKNGVNSSTKEFRLKTRSAGTIWVDVGSVRLDRNGVPYAILGIARDITERKLAEQALLASEERFRSIFNHAAEMIFLYDERGRFLDANDRALSALGYDRTELTALEFGDLLDERDVKVAWEGLRQVLVNGSSKETVEYRIKTRDGRFIWVEVTGVRIVFSSGTVAGLGIARDISDKKKAEVILRETEEQLIMAQKMEAVGRLAGGVAHDFNNILSVITGQCDLILDDLDDDHPLRADIREIAGASQRAADLTRQLLAFGRKQVMRAEILALNDVVASTEKLLVRLIGEDIDLVTDLDPSIAAINADPGQIEQVIMNLAVNARDAMPDGGKFIIETSMAVLDDMYASLHASVSPGRYVMLAVSDTGEGMDPETSARVFEPFFTTKEKGRGTGLGLSTVYGIVKQSGGHIVAYGHPGQGTTFKIYLPAVEDRPAVPLRPSQAPAGDPGGTETVLVVEDEETVRRLVVRILEHNGYSVLEAASGPEALDLVREARPDIQMLLTDVVMPGMSGRQLADRLTAELASLRVLYMSGYTDDAIVDHGLLEKGIAYISKPFSAAALAEKVRAVLDEP
ncbi:MAG: PAS domain S-box protein, partial [Deltaproteobacteria bacterium]|nr:PAS domain S-box protein [Deltaproteobacteria bacterium]